MLSDRRFADVPHALGGVELVHWNPSGMLPSPFDPAGPMEQQSMNNFGDLLGPLLAARLAPRPDMRRRRHRQTTRRLLTVGSVLHFAEEGDTVWGSGVNAKMPDSHYRFRTLDVRAVRGPLTAAWLNRRGIASPAIYGDPALLIPDLFPVLRRWARRKVHDLTVLPNLNDWDALKDAPGAWHPRLPLGMTLRRIAESRFVTGSSLHGIVLADSLGIPARLIASTTEPLFKYEDYYQGTGRELGTVARDVREAERLGGAEPLDRWDPALLREAFPRDLWSRSQPRGRSAASAEEPSNDRKR